MHRIVLGLTLAAWAAAACSKKSSSNEPPPAPADKPIEGKEPAPAPVSAGASSIPGAAMTLGSDRYRVGAVLAHPRFDGEDRLLGLRGDDLVAVDAATGAVRVLGKIAGAETLTAGPGGSLLIAGNGVSFVDRTGAVTRSVPIDAGTVTSVGVTSGGDALLLSGHRGAILVVDAATGAERERIPAGDDGFSDVAFAGSDARLIARRGEAIVVVERAGGKELAKVPLKTGTWALGGPYLATVAGGSPSEGYDVDVWNAETGTLVVGIHRERDIRALAWLPDGATLVVGGEDGAIERYQIAGGAATPVGQPVTLHGGAIAALAVSPSGARIAAVTSHGAVRFFDTAAGVVAEAGPGHLGPVERLAFNGDFLISGGADATIWTWELTGSRRTAQIDLDGDLMAMTTGPDDEVVYAQVDVYARPAGDGYTSLARHMIEGWTLSGARKASAELDQGADGLKYCPLRKAIQVVVGQYWKEIDPTTFDVSARGRSTGSRGRLGPNARFAAFEGHGALIVVDDVGTRRLGTAECSLVRGVAFDPAGAVIAMTDGTDAIRLWNIHGELIAGVSVSGAGGARDGVVLPDQRTALFTLPSGVLVWDQAAGTAGKVTLPLPPQSMALTPAGDRLAIGFADGRVGIFEVAALRKDAEALATGPAAALTDDDCHKLDPEDYVSAMFAEGSTHRFGDPKP